MKKLLVTTAVFLLAFSLAPKAFAAEFMNEDRVDVEEDQLIADNLYAVGERIVISGVVEGDLFVAGNSVEVDGRVMGDVFGGAQSIEISGEVDGDVRVAASSVNVSGSVAGDLIVFSAQVTIAEDAVISGDLIAYGGEVDLGSGIAGDAWLGAGMVSVDGTIGGNVRADGGDLRLLDDALIQGDLDYSADEKLTSDEEELVAGSIEYRTPKEYKGAQEKSFADKVVHQIWWRIYVAVGFIIVGLVALWLMPRYSRHAGIQLTQNFWRNLGFGALFLFVTPIACVVLFATIIGAPLGLIGSLLFVVGWMVSVLPLAYYVGAKALGMNKSAKVQSKYAIMVVGILLVQLAFGILSLIPFLGMLLIWVAKVWGFGVLGLSLWNGAKLDSGSKKAETSK